MKKDVLREKIQTKLAELSFAISPVAIAKLKIAQKNGGLDMTVYASQEWQATKAYYAHKRQDCELCGHANLMRVFVIKSQSSGRELHIGSECVRNYLNDDIVAGICKLFDLEYNKIVNPVKYEDAMEALRWAYEQTRLGAFRYYSFNGRRGRLQNYGDPSAVIRKIDSGKPIGKNEREVMDFWKEAFERREQLAWDEFAFAVKREFERRAAQEAWEAKLRWEGFISFFSNLEAAYLAAEKELMLREVVKVFDWFTDTTKKRDVFTAFNVAYNMQLDYGTKRFLNSLYAAHKNFGLSDAQKEALFNLAGI